MGEIKPQLDVWMLLTIYLDKEQYQISNQSMVTFSLKSESFIAFSETCTLLNNAIYIFLFQAYHVGYPCKYCPVVAYGRTGLQKHLKKTHDLKIRLQDYFKSPEKYNIEECVKYVSSFLSLINAQMQK